MGNLLCGLCLSLAAAAMLVGCNIATLPAQPPAQSATVVQSAPPETSPGGVEAAFPDAVLQSYYAAQGDPAFEYFQHKSIQRFLAMWVKEETTDIDAPVWDLDSFTQITVLDHDLQVSRPDEQLYCCTFSDGGDRFGYIIVKYDPTGPAMGNWGVTETTPYVYDLRANEENILASLRETDIDLSTAAASRVYLFDRDNSRADQVVCFTDKTGATYFCYLGDTAYEVKKWEAG